MVIDSLAHIYTGMTIKIKDVTEHKCDFYILEDGQFCDAMPKKCVSLISKSLFDFFEPRTVLIKKFIADND